MDKYLTEITSLNVKPRSLNYYWSKPHHDIIPGVGQCRIDKLGPEHPDRIDYCGL
ncbi:hypothetical protein [Streptomyces piniterrae]|uniref:hypothetical protein n=1 Tax=Streptomyces piniterrae TaxID=2571125 RepID=UPI00145E2978